MKCEKTKNWGMLVARSLIGLLFVMAAVGKIQDIQSVAGYIGTTWMPASTFLAWAAVVMELAGGLMLILGVHANAAALFLAVFLTFVSFTFHFNLADQQQTMKLISNFAIVGGLLSVFFSGPGEFVLMKCKCCLGLCSTKKK